MKKITLVILSSFFLSGALYAIDIESDIEAVQSATGQERVELMNQLKQKIRGMSEEDRMKAIKQIQEKNQIRQETMNRMQTAMKDQDIQNQIKSQIQMQNMDQIKSQIQLQRSSTTNHAINIGTPKRF